jgi:hypothetical protein
MWRCIGKDNSLSDLLFPSAPPTWFQPATTTSRTAARFQCDGSSTVHQTCIR